MTGGTKGAANMGKRGPKTGFFHSQIRHAFASGDREIQGRILPAFDTSLSVEDKAYKTSYVAYRDMSAEPSEYDQDTNTPPFTGWFQLFKGYRFVGRSMDSFISPLTLRGIVPDTDSRCPLFDCYMKAKKSDNPDWTGLIGNKNASKDERGVLPAPSVLAVLNMYLKTEKDGWENAAFTMPQASLIDFKTKLSVLTPRSMPEPYDPDFPDFLFGDITHPNTGLMVTGAKIALATNAAIKFNGFRIGRSERNLDGVAKRPVTDDVLARRYDLSSDSVLKILSYQDIVNLILDDGFLPYDLVAEACSEFADVSESRVKGTPVTQTKESRTPSKAAGQAAEDKLLSRDTGARGDTYWTVSGGKTVKVAGSEITERVENGEDPKTIKVMHLDKTGGWQTAADMGWKASSEDEAPPPPDEDDAPPPPDEDDAPPPPDDDAPPAPDDDGQSGLTADELQELNELNQAVLAGTTLKSKQLTRMVELQSKKG